MWQHCSMFTKNHQDDAQLSNPLRKAGNRADHLMRKLESEDGRPNRLHDMLERYAEWNSDEPPKYIRIDPQLRQVVRLMTKRMIFRCGLLPRHRPQQCIALIFVIVRNPIERQVRFGSLVRLPGKMLPGLRG